MSRQTDTWMAEAAAHTAAGNYRDAGVALGRVLQHDPLHATAATQLAELEIDHGQHGNGMARLLAVLRGKPRFAPAVAGLARACLLNNRLDEALVHCREARALDPAEPRYQLLEARILLRCGQRDAPQAAATALLVQHATRPEIAGGAHTLLAEIMEAEGDPAATARFGLAAAALPLDPDCHVRYGIALLRAGRFAEGWDEYAWRFRTLHLRRQALSLPDEAIWTGQPLRGRTIVLSDEQGIGDAIQFFRYLPMVATRGPARLIHVAFPSVARLFRVAAPVAEVVAALPYGTDLHFHSTTMGLARVFQTRLETIPAPMPYLFAEPGTAAQWLARLQGEQRPRVGLVWSGNPGHGNDQARSIPAALMLRLAALPGTFFALQPEIRPEDLTAVAHCPALRQIGAGFRDFADTAAAIMALDLVVTVDTAVAHLAGALGKPVWILLPRVADWRWLEHRDDSPWYPTARLFRCGTEGWPPVIERVAAALHDLAGTGSATVAKAVRLGL